MKSVLFANPFGLGDVIFTLRAVGALKSALPEVRIGFLGNERTAELLRLALDVDTVHTLDRDGFRSMGWPALPGAVHRLFREVAQRRYDALIDVSLGRELSLYAALAGIPLRAGFDYKGRGSFLTHRYPLDAYEGMSVSGRQAGLLGVLGVQDAVVEGAVRLRLSEDAHSRARTLLRGIRASGQPLAVAPGGGRSWGRDAHYKQWDVQRFAQAAGAYAARHGCGLLLIGDVSEKPLLERVLSGSGAPGLVMAGHPLEEVAAALRQSRALLCNDGGPMHLAGALGVRVAALFGPVDAVAYGPIDDASGVVLTADVPCRPCYRRFRFTGCEHQKACLERISVDKVMSALEEIV